MRGLGRYVHLFIQGLAAQQLLHDEQPRHGGVAQQPHKVRVTEVAADFHLRHKLARDAAEPIPVPTDEWRGSDLNLQMNRMDVFLEYAHRACTRMARWNCSDCSPVGTLCIRARACLELRHANFLHRHILPPPRRLVDRPEAALAWAHA